MAYSVARDIYTCDICGFEMKWDGHDEVHGDMWGCEKCGSTFCSKCFKDKYGEKAYQSMMQDFDLILCPDCYEKKSQSKGEISV